MKAEKTRLLGAHMSIAGGVAESIERGASIGCTAIQIFTGFNNRWISKTILPEEREKFHQNRDRVGIVFAHNNYLINLASPDPVISKKSYMSMLDELNRAEELLLPFTVLHPGAHMGSGEEAGLKRIITHLNALLSETRGSSFRVLIETTAGQGTNLGHRFEHIAEILTHINSQERIGVCFDTCHSFAAGYDLRTQKEYEQTFQEFDSIIGISHLYAFHLNDSKNELGSRKDRHEHIGKGFLGLETFRLLLNDERFIHLPMILETPKGDDMKEDIMNLAVLRGLIEENKA